MQFQLPTPPRLDEDERRWRLYILECMRELQRASEVAGDKIADEFGFAGVLTEARTLPAATGSLAEVRNVLGTLIRDQKKRGKKGTA